MNKIANSSLAITLSILSVLTLNSQIRPADAQSRGTGSQEFFEEGDQQMEQNVQELQNQQQQEQEEQKLEQNLNIQHRGTEIEETPDNPAALDDNVPESPEQEIQIKFPKAN